MSDTKDGGEDTVRSEMRAANLKAWDERPATPKLDSNIKKTNSLLRTLKLVSAAKEAELLRGIGKLNLSRYLAEVSVALTEAKLSKLVDISAAASIASAMHQRYPEFSQMLLAALLRSIGEYLADIAACVGKARGALRLLVELNYLAVVKADSELVSLIRELLLLPKKKGKPTKPLSKAESNMQCRLTVLLSVLRFRGAYLTGVSSPDDDFVCLPGSVNFKVQEELLLMCQTCFDSQIIDLKKVYKDMEAQRALNTKVDFYKGVVADSAVEKLRVLSEEYEGLFSLLSNICQYLDRSVPVLVEEVEVAETPVDPETGAPVRYSFFDDEETDAFYTRTIDLAVIVPPVLLKDGGKKPQNPSTPSDPEHAGMSPFEAWSQKLLNALSRDAVDKAAEDFCYINSKAIRKSLVEFLHQSNRSRSDLLPFFGRLMASLTKVLPDIGPELVVLVKNQFYGSMKHKDQHNLASKVRVVRFIGELVKFEVAHHSVAFDVWNFCLSEFFGHSIHVLCALVESCGRWMFRNPETNERCRIMIERTNALKTKKLLDTHLKNMVDNALMTCDPPTTTLIKPTVRPILFEYVRKLLHDLDETSFSATLDSLLSLKWDDECLTTVCHCFTEIYNIRAGGLPLVANILADLDRYHPVQVRVADAVLEEIRYGLELNDFSNYQRRLSYVRFLGELYAYYCIDEDVIFDVLYLLITFGSDTNPESSIDPSTDTFRIRLICCLLDTCGRYFLKGASKRRLTRFLVYFQRYVLLKKSISIDARFAVEDLMEVLRPKNSRFTTLEECQAKIAEMESKSHVDTLVRLEGDGQTSVLSPTVDVCSSESEEELEAELDDDEAYDWSSRGLSSRSKGKCEEDAAFLDMFDQMVADTVEQRKVEPRVVRNLVDSDTLAMQAILRSSSGAGDSSQSSTTQIRVLTRAGKNRVAANVLNVPANLQLAKQTHTAELEHMQEQLAIRAVVRDRQYMDSSDEEIVPQVTQKAPPPRRRPPPPRRRGNGYSGRGW